MTHCTDSTGCRVSCSSDSVCGTPNCGHHICTAHAFPINLATEDEDPDDADWLLVCRACAEEYGSLRKHAS